MCEGRLAHPHYLVSLIPRHSPADEVLQADLSITVTVNLLELGLKKPALTRNNNGQCESGQCESGLVSNPNEAEVRGMAFIGTLIFHRFVHRYVCAHRHAWPGPRLAPRPPGGMFVLTDMLGPDPV